jgi:cell wall-associated NlpC family hydrolase
VPTHALRPITPAVADTPVATVRRSPLIVVLALFAALVMTLTLGACTAPSSSTKGSQIVSIAKSKLGARYVYGAAGPNTFDCSGFTQWVYGQAGIRIARTTSQQAAQGRYVSASQAQPGDIVVIGDYHVGIYVGGGQMIDAPKTGDVVKQRAPWTGWSARRF